MNRWFRLYDEVLDDPKVQRLPDRIFKTWINILCAASRNNGTVPALADLAFLLRRDEAKLFADIADLTKAGLIDDGNGALVPHNWQGRQFQSDKSTERVKRFRGRSSNAERNVSETVNETAPDTETEPETERVAAQPLARAAEKPEMGIPITPATSAEPRASITIPVALRRGERDATWFDQVEAECRAAAGLENDPSPGLLDTSPIVTLLDQGYDFGRDILPKLRAAKAANKRGRTWAYYVAAIVEGKTANGKIAPKTTPTGKAPDVWIDNEDPRWRPLAEKWAQLKGKPPPVLPGSHGNMGQGWHFPADMVAA